MLEVWWVGLERGGIAQGLRAGGGGTNWCCSGGGVVEGWWWICAGRLAAVWAGKELVKAGLACDRE
jgi:hypothetical protein